MNKPITEGYWENASGAFVPEANVKKLTNCVIKQFANFMRKQKKSMTF